MLLHVVDVSDPDFMQQIQVTNETLEQIGAHLVPALLVFNKTDLTDMEAPRVEDRKIYISAKNKTGIKELVELVGQEVFTHYVECKMLIPYDRRNIVSYFNENANVRAVSYENSGTLLTMECREGDLKRYPEFCRSLRSNRIMHVCSICIHPRNISPGNFLFCGDKFLISY